MALLTLLLATKRGCRWLEACRRFVQLDGQSRIYLVSVSRWYFYSPESLVSGDICRRFVAGFATAVDAGCASRNAEVVSAGSGISFNRNDGITQASLCLQRIFGFDVVKADHWVKSYEGFSIIDPSDIERNYEACVKAGFNVNVVEDNIGMISYPHNILMNKIEIIGGMGIEDINSTVAFFHLGITKLVGFSSRLRLDRVETGGKHNRITYLSEQLEHSQLQICNVMAKYYFMQTVLYSKLVIILKIMFDYNVSREDILSDVWAFRYRPDVITERLKLAVDAGVSPIKPWMIRCPESCLSRRIGKELSRRSVLGSEGTSIEYLSKRLGYDEKLLADILSKNSYLPQVSGPKMKKVVDFLFENGYTGEDFIRVPRILLHKIDTMKERLDELYKYGHRPKSLMVFCKSQREYEAYLNTVKVKWMAKK